MPRIVLPDYTLDRPGTSFKSRRDSSLFWRLGFAFAVLVTHYLCLMFLENFLEFHEKCGKRIALLAVVSTRLMDITEDCSQN